MTRSQSFEKNYLITDNDIFAIIDKPIKTIFFFIGYCTRLYSHHIIIHNLATLWIFLHLKLNLIEYIDEESSCQKRSTLR